MNAHKRRDKLDDSISNERLLRYKLYREHMLYRAGLRCKFQNMRKWHKYCEHEESPRRQTMNYLILQSTFLPYSDQTITQHLSRTHRWMRNPGRNSFYRGLEIIRKVKMLSSIFLIFFYIANFIFIFKQNSKKVKLILLSS